ncbi:hypothetical protein HY041_01015 [Candidatus Roizmanbacteria bacterium]|nr:hypothetical protein [Candidatus Roizmanbacteria bacterium]
MADITPVDVLHSAFNFVARKIHPTEADKINEQVKQHLQDLPLIDEKGKFIFSGTRDEEEKRTTPWLTKGGSGKGGFTTLTFRDFNPEKNSNVNTFKSVLEGGFELKDWKTTEGDLAACAKELEDLGYDLKGIPPSRIALSVVPGTKNLQTISQQEWWFKNPETGRMSAVILAYEPETTETDRSASVNVFPRRIYVSDAIVNPAVGKPDGIKPERIYQQKPPVQRIPGKA